MFARGAHQFRTSAKTTATTAASGAATAPERYRLAPEQILACADAGWQAGFRTFVLQGGEDPAATDEWLAGVVAPDLKAAYPLRRHAVGGGARGKLPAPARRRGRPLPAPP